MARKLNEKQRAFAVAYAKDSNATKAALSVGYSEKSAPQMGYKLTKHPRVAAEISRLTTKIEKKSELDVAKVLAALNSLLDFDPADLFDEHGKLLKMKEMSLEARRCIASIDYDKQTVKFVPRLGSLELAAKAIGLLRAEPQGQQTVTILLSPSMQPPAVDPADQPKIVPVWQ